MVTTTVRAPQSRNRSACGADPYTGDHRRFVVIGEKNIRLGQDPGQGFPWVPAAEQDYVENRRTARPPSRAKQVNQGIRLQPGQHEESAHVEDLGLRTQSAGM